MDLLLSCSREDLWHIGKRQRARPRYRSSSLPSGDIYDDYQTAATVRLDVVVRGVMRDMAVG